MFFFQYALYLGRGGNGSDVIQKGKLHACDAICLPCTHKNLQETHMDRNSALTVNQAHWQTGDNGGVRLQPYLQLPITLYYTCYDTNRKCICMHSTKMDFKIY